jgi:hypothetical protein
VEIITKFLETMQVLQWVALAMAIAIGGTLITVGIWRKSYGFIAAGAVIATFQFVVPAFINLRQDGAVAQRRDVVATFKRFALRADYPRQIEVRGDVFDHDIAKLMILGYFDQAIVIDTGQSKWFGTVDRSLACRTAVAVHTRARLAMTLNLPWVPSEESKEAFAKIKSCAPVSDKPFPRDPNFILVRLDSAATLRANDRRPAPDAVQIDLVAEGTERLAFYDEMTVPEYQRSATRLLTDGPDYPCYGFDNVQILANVLDAARHPEAARTIMERPGDPTMCVQAAPLIRADEVRMDDQNDPRAEFVQLQTARLKKNPPWYVDPAAER